MDWKELGGRRLSPPVTHDRPHCPALHRAVRAGTGPGGSPTAREELACRELLTATPQPPEHQRPGTGSSSMRPPRWQPTLTSFCSWKGVQEPWGAVGALPGPWLGLGHGSRRLPDNQFCILPPRSPENHFTEQNEDTEMRFRCDTRLPLGQCFIRVASSTLDQTEGGCGAAGPHSATAP